MRIQQIHFEIRHRQYLSQLPQLKDDLQLALHPIWFCIIPCEFIPAFLRVALSCVGGRIRIWR